VAAAWSLGAAAWSLCTGLGFEYWQRRGVPGRGREDIEIFCSARGVWWRREFWVRAVSLWCGFGPAESFCDAATDFFHGSWPAKNIVPSVNIILSVLIKYIRYICHSVSSVIGVPSVFANPLGTFIKILHWHFKNTL
jgi:hypothetical protein